MRGGRVVAASCLAFVVGCGGNASVGGEHAGATPVGSGGAPGAGGTAGAGSGGASAPGGSSGAPGGPSTELPGHGSFHPGGADGGAPEPVDAGEAPAGSSLRDTPQGGVVSLDPDRVYVIGPMMNTVDDPNSPRGIAPLADPSDAVGGFPLFADHVVRRTDGHVAYSYLGSVGGIGMTTPLYEFRRDETPGAELTAGEALLDDGPTECNLQPGYSVRYRMAYDGTVAHTCPDKLVVGPGIPDSTAAWFTPGGTQLPVMADFTVTVGPTGRAVGMKPDYTLVVFDATTGAEHGTVPPRLYSTSNGDTAYATAARARTDGFFVMQAPADQTARCEMVNLNLDGGIISRTDCAPLPSGVTVNTDYWFVPPPALDADGAIYHFAREGDRQVIVRRPLAGASTVVYREEPVDPSRVNVLPEELLSGI